LRKAQGDVGELLRTLAQYTDIQIYVQNEQVASLKREDTEHRASKSAQTTAQLRATSANLTRVYKK